MKKYMPLWPCVSRKTLPHDVVGVNMWLKMWDKGRKGEYGTTVNQEFDLAGKSENGRNLSKTIPHSHLILKKSAGVGLWPPAQRAYGSKRYSGSTYNHLSDTGS
jgi:hypothetical protein